MVGLGWTPEKTAHFFPEIVSSAAKASVANNPGSVTINGLRTPSALNCCGNSPSAPAPNRIFVGKEKFEIVVIFFRGHRLSVRAVRYRACDANPLPSQNRRR